MMCRCGRGTKADQDPVLPVEISREGFVGAPRNACLSHYVPEPHGDRAAWKRQLRQGPARVQWTRSAICTSISRPPGRCSLGSPVRRRRAVPTSGSWA